MVEFLVSETGEITLPQAASIFVIPRFDDILNVGPADSVAALGGYHYDYDLTPVITLQQAASIFVVPFLDAEAAFNGGDGSHILGGYRFDYSVPVVPDSAVAASGGFERRKKRKRRNRKKDDVPTTEKIRVAASYVFKARREGSPDEAPEIDFSPGLMAKILDMPDPIPQSEIVVFDILRGLPVDPERKRRIALSYLLLE